MMIDDCGVTLNGAIHSQIAAESSICDFTIFHELDGHLNCIKSRTPILEDYHRSLGRTRNSQTVGNQNLGTNQSKPEVSNDGESARSFKSDLLIAGLQMSLFIQMTMESRSRVHKDGRDISAFSAAERHGVWDGAHVFCRKRVKALRLKIVLYSRPPDRLRWEGCLQESLRIALHEEGG